MTRESTVGTILGFILGAAAGAVTALLVAPRSGAKLRSEIAEGLGDGVNQVRSSAKDLKRRAQELVNSAKGHIGDAVDAGQVAYEHAKDV